MEKDLNTEFFFTFAEPIVCTAIHNGHDVSVPVLDNLGITEEERLREEDPYTSCFTLMSQNRIIQHKSRFEYDLNRQRDKAFYLVPQDAWGLSVRKREPEQRVIEKCLNQYDVFYRRVNCLFQEMLKTFDCLFVMDIHSYNHQREGADKPFDNLEENPEVILGTNNMPEKWFSLVEMIREELTKYDYFGRKIDVRINVKFSGGHFSRWVHDSFPGKVFCLAIEFKKIFMNEWTGELYKKEFQELRRAFMSVKHTLMSYYDNTN